MSTEFNYCRAWNEYNNPEFKRLMRNKFVKAAWKAVSAESNVIGQPHGTAVVGESQAVRDAMDAVPAEILAKAEHIMYGYGHYAYKKITRKKLTHGENWKFQAMAAQSLIRRPDTSELRHFAKLDNESMTDCFMEHKPGTDYDNEEVTALYASFVEPEFTMVKADNVNHRPDVFCIGNAHMRLSQGMFLDPNVAPCCNCGQPYSKHISDRVVRR